MAWNYLYCFGLIVKTKLDQVQAPGELAGCSRIG